MKKLRSEKILLISIFLFSILWATSIYLSSPIYSRDWGLLKGIHPLFYVCLLFITLVFIFQYFHEEKDRMLPYCLVIIVLILYYSYSLIERTIELTPYNTYLDFVRPIISTGVINPQRYWYQSWPLGLIFEAIFFEITSINPNSSLLFIPILTRLLLIPVIFSIAVILLNDRKIAWIACFLFFTMNTVDLNNFIPSNISFIVWLVTLSVFLLQEGRKYKSSLSVLFVILSLSLALYHFLYSVFFISFLVILKIFHMTRITKENVSSNYILFISVILISWMIYSICFMLESILSQTLSIAFNLNFLAESGAQAIGSNSYTNIKTIRNIGLLLFCLFSLVGVYAGICDNKYRKAVSYSIAIILSVFIWLPATPYGGEFLTRSLLFSALPLSILCSVSLDSQKTRKKYLALFCIFLILTPFVHLVSVYGLKESKYVPNSDAKLSTYLYTEGKLQSKIIALPFGLLLDFREDFHRIDISSSLVNEPGCIYSKYAIKTKMSNTFARNNLVQLGYIHEEPQDYELFFKRIDECPLFLKIYTSDENSIIFMRSE